MLDVFFMRLRYRCLLEAPLVVNPALVSALGEHEAAVESARLIVQRVCKEAIDFRGRPKPGYETTLRKVKGVVHVGVWKKRWT